MSGLRKLGAEKRKGRISHAPQKFHFLHQTLQLFGRICKEHQLHSKEETMKAVLVSSLLVHLHQYTVFLFSDNDKKF